MAEVMQLNLTSEDIKRASTYIPLIQKTAMAKLMAQACIEKLDVRVKGDRTDEDGKAPIIPMPDMYQENVMYKTMCCMFALTYFYLKLPFVTDQYNPNDGILLGADDCDRYRHIFSQLERFKSDKDLRDTVYDMLADYKDFEKRLNCEIHNVLAVKNDITVRIFSMISMQSSPSAIQNALQDMEGAAAQAQGTSKHLLQQAKEMKKEAAQKRSDDARVIKAAQQGLDRVYDSQKPKDIKEALGT